MSRIQALLTSKAISLDSGLLLIRLGIGLSMLLFHGYDKLVGGPETWARIGSNMQHLGINFLPTMWGFLAAFSESFCSLFLILGVLTRPAAAALAFTMLVAVLRHLNAPADSPGAGWSGASHALELFSVYLGLLLAGAGRYRLFAGQQNSA